MAIGDRPLPERRLRLSACMCVRVGCPCVQHYFCLSPSLSVFVAGSVRLEMSSSSADPLFFFTTAYFRDGVWWYEHIPVTIAVLCVHPSEQHDVRCPTTHPAGSESEADSPLPRSPFRPFHEALRTMCSSWPAVPLRTMEVEKDLVLRLHNIPLLSSCRVEDNEPFGELSHWSRLIEHTGAQNIVLFSCVLNGFFVVCARARNTQRVQTRSALCWLRQRAGLGFASGADGGVFRIQVSKHRCVEDDYWVEGLAQLVRSISVVFPRTGTREQPSY